MKKLTEIANKHNTDKGTVAYEAHGYTEEYEKYIPDKGEFILLEIGIWHGDSLRMWNEYNSDMSAHGLDIDYNCLKWVDTYLHPFVHIGNATNSLFIDKVLSISGKPDFIIDDGSHKYEDILASFKLLYPKLKKGGYYFIEDLHAGQAQKHNLISEITSNYDFNNFGFRCDGKLWIIEKP